jgi:hypothetical protein
MTPFGREALSETSWLQFCWENMSVVRRDFLVFKDLGFWTVLIALALVAGGMLAFWWWVLTQ